MLYATFVNPDDPSVGVAIYDDETHNSTGPLVIMDWDEMHRLILEMQSLRDQRDVQIRRAKLTLVPKDLDIMDRPTARDEMPETIDAMADRLGITVEDLDTLEDGPDVPGSYGGTK